MASRLEPGEKLPAPILGQYKTVVIRIYSVLSLAVAYLAYFGHVQCVALFQLLIAAQVGYETLHQGLYASWFPIILHSGMAALSAFAWALTADFRYAGDCGGGLDDDIHQDL
eukprot:INCI2690.1.p1 GENE.INCI2690.1~~INCI2690.1.p1  ORF type:complete len:112 (+),score=5.49 INCI2690.1:122-457(+)